MLLPPRDKEQIVLHQNDLPKVEHFAALIFKTKYEHDLYDSRANGYNIPVTEYITFPDEQSMLEWVKYTKDVYKLILVKPLTVELSYKIG